MPKLDLSKIIKEEVRDSKGNLISEENMSALPPTVNLTSRKGMAGVVAAQTVLASGGNIQQALDAAVKARESIQQAQDKEPTRTREDEELETLMSYMKSVARLQNGKFDELTPRELLEVTMLCPYPVCSIDEWKAKMKLVTGR